MGGRCSKAKQQQKSNFKFPPIEGHNYEYDLIVIGGGSGGLAAAKQAREFGKRVCVCDFVTPTPFGTTWGLGGTCTNVGCVPKKLMHTAALTGKSIASSGAYGFTIMPNPSEEDKIRDKLQASFDWKQFVDNVQTYIKSLNWNNKVMLREREIDYFNEYAEFVGVHTLKLTNKNKEIREISGNIILLANGGRPKYLDAPGGRFEDAICITSDDLFSLPYPPGKTLIVGASYVALECAGFLIALGFEVTVVVRSRLLRGYDKEMSNKIGAHLKSLGVKFLEIYEPVEIHKVQDGNPPLIRVKCRNGGKTVENEYNTVLLAIGRIGMTSNMNTGVKINPANGRILVNANDQTNVLHIFAVGDVADGRPEFSPVAIRAGKLLVLRLFKKGFNELMDYDTYPVTVFTPIEYGSCGLSEEKASEIYGPRNLEVYQSNFSPLEEELPGIIPPGTCHIKLICLRNKNELVVGLHYYGPNAGEVVQGWALGFRLGAKKSDFDSIIGIHPTCSERFTTLHITKRGAKAEELESC